MKKIIDGRVYDTSTAVRLCGWWEGVGDWINEVSEDLYRTSRGAYFIFGEGGPATEYGRPAAEGGGIVAGSRITPISEDEARSFASRHTTTREYEAIFGPTEEA